ncbi:MAG: DUF1287 domain-containing protein [Novosphingobium sp.]|nr:DUF1287 domain-containing protein [Novosphingobium sp.]MBP6554690.1 DUF1287 domain-containing protein [Novosphingobium sp.]
MMLSRRSALLGGLALAACGPAEAQVRPATARAKALIAAARRQVGVTLAYDPAYTALDYPGGDVPRGKGVCTDVLIRAYRDAFGLDLQVEVHRDMAANFRAYPKRWSLKRPDRNIDHRRVPNLETFWTRQSARLPIPARAEDWQPGDLFTTLIEGRLPHTGIVSDRLAGNGNPLVIHNIGSGAREEDMLLAWRPTGRFRWRL